jgi:hypothetical protein
VNLAAAKKAAFLRWQELRDAHGPPPAPGTHPVQQARAAYRRANAATKCSAAADKQRYYTSQGAHIQRLFEEKKISQAYKAINTLTGRKQPQQVTAINSPEGATCYGTEVLPVLREHYQRVLNVEGPGVAPHCLAALAAAAPGASTGQRAGALVQWIGAFGDASGDGFNRCLAALAPPPPPEDPPSPQQQPAAEPIGTQTRQQGALAAARAAEPPAPLPPPALGPGDGSVPTVGDVLQAVQRLHNTAPGLDGIPAGLLKAGQGLAAAEWLHGIISAVWEVGVAPLEWKQAALASIYKGKGCRLSADSLRGVSLLSTSGKVYVLLLLGRISNSLNRGLMEEQCGFRPGRGTGDQLFTLRRVQELAREWRVPLHAAFIDLTKAFDSVNREVLWGVLRARGVDPKLLALIQDLYSGCSACASLGGHTSDWFPMRTGVRQGCPMSPLLFNVFMDFICRLVCAECEAAGVRGYTVGYRVQGSLVRLPQGAPHELHLLMLLYADDVVLLAPDPASLAAALSIFERVARTWGLALNYDKTKVVVFGEAPPADAAAAAAAAPPPPPQPQQGGPEVEAAAAAAAAPAAHPACSSLEHGQVEQVGHFPYLGSTYEASGGQERELCSRMAKASAAFKQLRQRVFKNQGITLACKLQLYRAVVLSTLLYGAAECWALTVHQQRRVDAFHTRCLRSILGVGMREVQRAGPDGQPPTLVLVPAISNEELLRRASMQPLSELMRCHRLRWLGHVARMGPERLPRRLLAANTVPGGSRRAAWQPRSWPTVAQEDLDSRNIRHNWQDLCQLRDTWSNIANGAAAT